LFVANSLFAHMTILSTLRAGFQTIPAQLLHCPLL
jgi:hypothetical protein